MNKYFIVIALISLVGCSATPEPTVPQQTVKNGNPTPCEVQSEVPCDNYDRAAILLGDAARTTVNGVKDASSWLGEKANQVYQDYQKPEEKK